MKTKAPVKRTKFGRELTESAREILAHLKGETQLPVRRIVMPDEVDVAEVRAATGMSQAEFARAFCINPRTRRSGSRAAANPTPPRAPTLP